MKLELRNKITLEKDGHRVIFTFLKENNYLGIGGNVQRDLFLVKSLAIEGIKSETNVFLYRYEIAERIRFYKKQLNYTEA